jgi:hypothetical protein
MIYVHSIKDQSRLEYIRNYKNISPNPYHQGRCVARERWQEIEYFSKTNQIIFWNSDTHTFTEYDFTPVIRDLSQEIIFPRPQVPEFYSITQDIINMGWKPLSLPHEFYAIERWMYIIPQKYINRKIITSTKEHVSQNFGSLYSKIKDNKGRFFIKSVIKDWSYDGSPEGWFETGMCLSLESGLADDQIMLSEWLELGEDEYDTLEYRCFVINGELKSISRFMDYELIPPPQEAYLYAQYLIDELVGKYMPLNIVIDIAQLKCGDWVLIEMNDPTCSGRYIGNTVELMEGK